MFVISPVVIAALLLCSGAAAIGLPSRKILELEEVDFALPTRELFRAQFKEIDFKFNFNAFVSEEGRGGVISGVSAANFPVIAGEGVAMTQLKLEPCAVNLAHNHPRGSELLTAVVAGPEGVATGFVSENGGMAVNNIMMAGEVALNPMGLIHYAQNLSCEPAILIAAFGSDNQGTQTTTTAALAKLPSDSTARALGITEEELATLIKGFEETPNDGVAECRKRCGMDAAGYKSKAGTW